MSITLKMLVFPVLTGWPERVIPRPLTGDTTIPRAGDTTSLSTGPPPEIAPGGCGFLHIGKAGSALGVRNGYVEGDRNIIGRRRTLARVLRGELQAVDELTGAHPFGRNRLSWVNSALASSRYMLSVGPLAPSISTREYSGSALRVIAFRKSRAKSPYL